MDFLIDSASAQAGTAPAGGGLMSILPLILLFVVFYFILIRPQMKRAKEHRKMVAELAVGDEVLTNGGLLGVVRQAGDTFLDVELGSNMTVKLHKHQVASVLPKGTWKAATKQGGGKVGKSKNKQVTANKAQNAESQVAADTSDADDSSR
jgi:preprotein translocase subunit YajC